MNVQYFQASPLIIQHTLEALTVKISNSCTSGPVHPLKDWSPSIPELAVKITSNRYSFPSLLHTKNHLPLTSRRYGIM